MKQFFNKIYCFNDNMCKICDKNSGEKIAVKLEPEMRISERHETDQNSIVRYAEP